MLFKLWMKIWWLLNVVLFNIIKYSIDAPQKLQSRTGLPILLLKLSEQLHIIWAELSGRGWWQGGRRKRCGGRGGSGLQGCGCRHLVSHLTDRVGHRVLHPWESRTQPARNLVCRHLRRTGKKRETVENDVMLGWTGGIRLLGQPLVGLTGGTVALWITLHLLEWTGIQIWNALK